MVMSPFSVHSALGMLLAGARNNTEREIHSALMLPDDEQVVNAGYSGVLHSLAQVDPQSVKLTVANRVFVEESLGCLTAFMDCMDAVHHATVGRVNFIATSEEAREVINAWAFSSTNGKVKDLLAPGSIDSLTRLVLVNAVHFKGRWKMQFNTKLTRAEPFYVTQEKKVSVNMMHIKDSFHYCSAPDLNATAVEMPYRDDRLSMIFFLPNSHSDLQFMEAKLSHPEFDLRALPFSGIEREILVSLPRFKIESSHDLIPPLNRLGIRDVFDEAACDLSGITGDRSLFASKVVQKAFIEVNEEGAEAAAATAVVMQLRCMPRPPPEFTCNRPFVFIIKDNVTKAILFSGRVMDPSV
eukprot:GEMP01037179.1.p1 GENE.GEMP01037179.1~~GEMP01037179.1.p1  ORF type:complete len:415 (+),score=89.27 GEMP01037179.1:185-1246(+)